MHARILAALFALLNHLGVIAAHAAASATLAAVLALVVLDRRIWGTLIESVQAGVFARDTLLGCLAHLGLSAALWGCIYVGFARLARARDARVKAPVQLGRRSGSVFVETLVVLPVALLLVFGIAQLALINIANVIANVATFEATRAAWLWYPETHGQRMQGLTHEQAAEKARVQATLALMTVAPGEYRLGAQLSESAKQARGMVVASQNPFPSTDSGAFGMTMAKVYTDEHRSVETQTSLALALDSSTLIKRSAKKFDAAYASTRVYIREFQDGDDKMIEVKLVYRHMCVMPMVAAVFCDLSTAEVVEEYGSHGYFTEVVRVLKRRQMLPPFNGWPEGQTISPIPFL